jgi:hypothetical protein
MTDKPIEKPVHQRTYIAYEGDTWNTFKLGWKNADGTVIDFTNATARSQFKKKRSDAIALLTLTESSGITLANASPNLQITLTSSQTTMLGKGIFVFDLEITQNGTVRTYADCILELKQSITKPS